jgi:hypothetical protein
MSRSLTSEQRAADAFVPYATLFQRDRLGGAASARQTEAA